uniref:Apolipoprotein A-V n=2 Tax=Pelodiscus sinensis TaxID=13735 RepID=K7G3T1_PELSI|nr:apolipoprotein A-V [Pelodiscus sinensis]XP_014428336.1 apolipoprotein A-V [Pelodiscus sinensis]XP_025039720.1 apolipoprotein A-V [Pelodiscus sinensis]|eukprot:XP_006121739.1 apolipoprotein A-V [Pelodiscus sinensis]
MTPKAALLALLLATFAACQDEQARNGFWDYLSQLTHDKASVVQTQSMKLDQEIKKVKESIQEGVSYMGNLFEKLAPFSRGLQPRFYEDSDGLRRLIRKELEGLRVKLSPYVDEVHQKINKHLEALHFQLTPFTEELLNQVLLKSRELQQHLTPPRDMKAQLLEGVDEVQRFMAQYAKKIAFHTDQVKEVVHPYVARLVTEIHRNMEELHRNLMPHTKVSPEKLNHYIQELSEKLTQNAKELHQKIQRNVDHLKEQLRLYPSGLREQVAGSAVDPHWAVDPYMEGLALEVQQRIEEFRRDTFLEIDDFTRTIDRETEEIKFKLSPLSPYSEEFDSSAPLEDLHVRLDSLWRDISQSLNERISDLQ